MNRDSRLVELDSIRGVAAIAVLLYHFGHRFFQVYPSSGNPIVLFAPGQFGVDLFFVLSGFVIYMSLERSPSLPRFLAGRFWRLYPTYWAGILLTFSVVSVFHLPGRTATFSQALVNLTMLQTFFRVPHVDGVYWTLTVELLFYGLMAGLLLIGRTKPASLILITATVAGLLPLLFEGSPFPLSSHAVKFAAGICYYQRWKEGRYPLEFPVAVGLMLLAPILAKDWMLLFATVAILAIFHAVLVAGWSMGLRSRPLVYLGAISYPLYLVHQNIGYVVLRIAEQRAVPFWIAFASALAVSLLLAASVHELVEKPVAKWRASARRARLRSEEGTEVRLEV